MMDFDQPLISAAGGVDIGNPVGQVEDAVFSSHGPTTSVVQYVEPSPVQVVEPVPTVVVQPPQQDDLSRFYAICDQCGPVEPDDDFALDGWTQFYPLNDPFFNWFKGPVTLDYRVYNPDDPYNLGIYEGEMRGGVKHGFGRMTTPKYVRLGMWRDDQFTGWGRESRRNGDVLEGRFIGGRLNGMGIMKNAKGNIYVGGFVDSRREGQGDLDTNKIHYKGTFVNDRLNGKGIIHFKVEGHDYEGQFRDNEITGQGVFRWSNGDVYQGTLKRGKMHGVGRYTYANGQVYEGEYVNGIKEGRGRLSYPNGMIFDGYFVAGRPNGRANIITGGKTIGAELQGGRFVQI